MLEHSGFQLAERLHEDAHTRVYRARRVADGRPVVLKILAGERPSATAIAQYRREFEITRGLGGVDGVIRVHELVTIQDSLMIVEDDIGAESLDRMLARGRPDLAETLDLAVRIARILDDIHRHKVIHKDLNPANIIWNRRSNELRIIDFGIASQLAEEHQEFQSPTQLEGTLAYTAPEQTGRVNRKLDYRVDLYAFGVTLYELLTGTLPFSAREGIELVHAHIALAPQPPHHRDARVPPMLSRIVMRLLEKMADDRYQSARGVEHDLERCRHELRTNGAIAAFPLGAGDVPASFCIPQRLYGRDEELAVILAAFDRAAAGPVELLLVKGAPGVGKSALVREVHRPLTERHGNFVAGKFDQYQRDVPFHAWTQAFQDFCTLLLQEDEGALARWRARILDGVGHLGRVLTDVIPSIELIIGRQPEIPPLAGEQALNRLNYVFGNFIKAVCTREHPLVIFIDDWQWADSGSLSLLRFIVGGGEVEHLLLIGACRDNEVGPEHPLAAALAEIRNGGLEVAEIELGNLAETDVRQLLDDAMGESPELADLSHLVYEKTQGNAFFLVQLLNDLHERAAILFDRESRRWVWRRDQVEATDVADNVVELMAKRIRSLPEGTQRALIHASCIGDRFELATLASILHEAAHRIAGELVLALEEGILVPLGTAYRFATQKNNTVPVHYQFVHDRVRQAAYGLIDEAARERAHFDIARAWLENWNAEEQERNIFDIANQYNAGRRFVEGEAARGALLAINLRAGLRAKQAADHITALNYLRAALELRGTDSWSRRHAQTLDLLLAASEAAFLCKEYAAMEEWLDEYLAHARDSLQRVDGHKIRLQAYVAQNRLLEAVDVGLHALDLLGVRLPRAPGKARVLAGLLQTRLAVKRKSSFTDLYVLPAMSDPRRLAAMELLGLLLPPAYWTSQGLLALVVFRMVQETLAHGFSPNAGYGLSWWGITQSALLGNIDAGAVFGEFAIELARKNGLKLQQPLFYAGWIIHKYKHPLRETLPLLRQAYAVSLEKGDFEYASYARNNEMQMLFHCGTRLDELLPEMEHAHRDLLRFRVGPSLFWHAIWWQTAQNFATPAPAPDQLAGTAYDETVSLPQHLRVDDHSSLFLLYCAKTMLACFHNDGARARSHAETARKSLAAGAGMHAEALFHFYESLALLDDADPGYRPSTQALQHVARNQKKLARWAGYAPANYRQEWCLVEAERLRVVGHAAEAMQHYEQAIDLARENGFIHEEALAHERAARFHRQQQRERLATHYLRQALQLYERWGAAGKVAHLRAEHPMLELVLAPAAAPRRTTQRRPSSGNGSQHGDEAFDIAAIGEASRAISGEIVIDHLVRTLLRIVVEHAGAQRAALILRHEDELRVAATCNAGALVEVSLDATPIDAHADLPLPRTLIQYVARTLNSMVIDDARAQTPFARDPHFLREQPLSVLCEPILQRGKLVGILYLENNLITGAFTPERLELLRVLSAQAAISIENAMLYGHLEQKVEERTQKLQDSLAVQERLNAELQASSVEIEAAYAKLSEANRQLEERANTDGLTGLANRRYFGERLEYELGRSMRDPRPLSLLICDLDNFKRYNDLYGHVAGDDCLRRVAATLQSLFTRTTDLVARYGGEEFVVLLPSTSSSDAAALGERMRQAVANLEIEHVGNAGFGIATISVGCFSLTPTPETTLEALIAGADRALYVAKDRGRNCLVCI